MAAGIVLGSFVTPTLTADVEAAASHVVRKIRELYRRLARRWVTAFGDPVGAG